MPDPLIGLRLDPEDLALLEACCTKEKLTKSDVLRRALRSYADQLEVNSAPKKRAKATKKR